MNGNLYVVYVGGRLDRVVIGVASTVDRMNEMAAAALASDEYAVLARECIGYDGPFGLDELDN